MFKYEDYRAAQEFIKKKSLHLMKHEGKEYAKVSFPIQNYRVYPIRGRVFYCAMTNVFKEIMIGVLREAIEKFPQKFGTGNAMDVVDAIYQIEPLFFDLSGFAEFLRSEQFCYVMENVDGVIQDRVLRIDLFRRLTKTKQETIEFTGGIFHAFKHFSVNGINLSTGKDINNIARPEYLIDLTIKAFFFVEEEAASQKEFRASLPLNNDYSLRFAFYFEQNTQVYFINTIFKESAKK